MDTIDELIAKLYTEVKAIDRIAFIGKGVDEKGGVKIYIYCTRKLTAQHRQNILNNYPALNIEFKKGGPIRAQSATTSKTSKAQPITAASI